MVAAVGFHMEASEGWANGRQKSRDHSLMGTFCGDPACTSRVDLFSKAPSIEQAKSHQNISFIAWSLGLPGSLVQAATRCKAKLRPGSQIYDLLEVQA